MSTAGCTQVSAACPVEATTYGYYPNLGGNAFLAAAFGLIFFLQVGLGIRYRTWTWAAAVCLGVALETMGYASRVVLNSNPWNTIASQIQIVVLILAPSFLSGGIDLTLKHIVIVFGRESSRIPPALYTWLFIGLDVCSIILQAAGGILAVANTDNPDPAVIDLGNNLILSGIILQVVQLVLFAIVSAEYLYRLRRNRKVHSLSPEANAYLADWKFRGFAASIVIAFVTILIRCIYRIPEMASGWGSELQRDEPTFMVLDGA